MVRKLNFFLIAISSFGIAHTQEWTFIRKQDVGQKITASDIGFFGKLFVGTERGNIYSFQQDGMPDRHFSSAIFQAITDLDASNSLRIFVFYKNVGQFEYLDRFTALPRTYQLEDFGLTSADHTALDADGTIWFLSGFTLSHVNVFNRSILSQQILPGSLVPDSITDMAFDQRIILSDRENGLSYWDGNQLILYARIASGVVAFDVMGDELVALGTQGILISNQRTGKQEWIAPPHADFTRVLKTGNVLSFIRGSEIFWYQRME